MYLNGLMYLNGFRCTSGGLQQFEQGLHHLNADVDECWKRTNMI